MTKQFYLFILMLLMAACSQKKSLAPKEYVDYLNSKQSGTLVDKELNDVRYRARLQPPAYLALVNSANPALSAADYKKELEFYKDKLNFLFLIEDADEKHHSVKSTVFDGDRYGTILSYANTDLKNDFMLITETDTLHSALVHLEAANSVEPHLRISVSFSGISATTQEYTLVYNDHIFNNGPIKFNYSKTVVKDLPEIKF